MLDLTRPPPVWLAEVAAHGTASSLSVGGRDHSPPGMSDSLRGTPLMVGGGGGALPADQIGWRPAEEEESARAQTFRQWARDHTGRTDIHDEGGTVLDADIVPGMWTCCRNLDPAAGGCLLTEHCLGDQPWESLPCDRCGLWVALGRWDVDKCSHHPGQLRRGRWGGHTWACCGASGVEGTKAADVKPFAWLQRRKEEEERRLQSRAAGRPGGGPPASLSEASGCALAQRHAFELEKHLPCGPDGLPVNPECPTCGAAAAVGQDHCSGCGEGQCVCVQCFKVVLADDVAAARASNKAVSCRFHPGVFCEARAARYASNQRKTVHCANKGCGYVALSRPELARHGAVCPVYEYACEHCNALLLRRNGAAHRDECRRLPLPCRCGAGCGREVPREEMAHHRDYFCPAQPTPCRHAGCDATPPRVLLAAHEAACGQALAFCARECGACEPCGAWPGQAAHDVSCPNLPLACLGCGGHQPRCWMERHLTLECPATVLRCRRCLMLTPRAGLARHDRVCLLKAVTEAWAEAVAGRQLACPHHSSANAGGCAFRGNRAELRAHLAECSFGPLPCEHCGAEVPRRESARHARECPARWRGAEPRCDLCGARTERDGSEVVVRVGSLVPVMHTARELDSNGRSRTYGEKVEVRRVRVVLTLAPMARAPHAERCPMRTERCAHCERELQHLALPSHELSCDQRKWPCARMCGASVSARGKAAHERVCPNALCACPYGCGKKLQLKEFAFRPEGGRTSRLTRRAPAPRVNPEPLTPGVNPLTASAASGGRRAAAAAAAAAGTAEGREAAWAVARAGPVALVGHAPLRRAEARAEAPLLCEPCETGDATAPASRARGRSADSPTRRPTPSSTPRLSGFPSAVARPEPELRPTEARQLLRALVGPGLLPPLDPAAGAAFPPELVAAERLLASDSSTPRFLLLVFVKPADRELPPLLRLLNELLAARPELRVLLVPLGAGETEVAGRRALLPGAFCLPPLGVANEEIARDYGARRGTTAVLLYLADHGIACFDAARALQADPRGAGFPWAAGALSSHARRCSRYWHGCPNARCTFSGVRAKLEAHRVSCLWRMLACRRNCGLVIEVSAHKEHAPLCPARPAECARGCGVGVNAGELASGEHELVCPLKGLSCAACALVVPRKGMELHNDSCPMVEELCRYGCSRRFKRRDMPAHAKECPAIGIKRFPVCDGYCCRRCPLHYDAIFGPPDGSAKPRGPRPASAIKTAAAAAAPGSARRPASAGKAPARRSWMMMNGVAVHWNGTDAGHGRGMKFFPTADSDRELGVCISQLPAKLAMPESMLHIGHSSRPRLGSPSRSR